VRVDLDEAETIPVDAVAQAIGAKLVQLDLNPGSRMAVAFNWAGDPEYSRLKAMASAIRRAVAPEGRRDELLLLMIDGDVGRSIGHLLEEELTVPGKIVSIDGVQLQELDYVDVGEMITPPGVVPVVIKSLLFS
jgi:ethanolamine utilization protein EutA